MLRREIKSYDVVIIGAGVQGLSAAAFIAMEGDHKVAVLDGRVSYGLGSSSRSGSMIMKSRENRPKIELSLFSFSFFERFEEVFGERLDFRRTGFMSLVARSLADRYQEEHLTRQALGVPSKILSAVDIAALCPQVRLDGIEFGVFCPDDGEVDASQIMRCYYDFSKDQGVDFYFDSEVIDFSVNQNVITRVITPEIEFDCGVVVNAAGPDAPRIGELAGICIPQSNRRRSIYFGKVEKPDRFIGPMVEDAKLEWYYRGLTDGSVLIGMGLEEESNITDGPNLDFLSNVRDVARDRVPSLANFELLSGHSGIRPLSPDIIPLIGIPNDMKNLVLNTGWGGEGIMHSPAGGAIVSDIIQGTSKYEFEVTAFDPNRFLL